MKNGTCIKCNAKTVYKLRDGVGSVECQSIMVGRWGKSTTNFDCYICTSCGYFENYVTRRENLDAIAQGKGNWAKVTG